MSGTGWGSIVSMGMGGQIEAKARNCGTDKADIVEWANMPEIMNSRKTRLASKS